MISLFENWRRDPSLALAYRFANTLGKRIEEVFPNERQALASEEPKASPPEPERLSSEAPRPGQNQVRASRLSKLWTQRELSERVGVAIGTINAIERGSWKPSLALAYAISQVLGESVLDLFPLDAFRKITPLSSSALEGAVSMQKEASNARPLHAVSLDAAGSASPELQSKGATD